MSQKLSDHLTPDTPHLVRQYREAHEDIEPAPTFCERNDALITLGCCVAFGVLAFVLAALFGK